MHVQDQAVSARAVTREIWAHPGVPLPMNEIPQATWGRKQSWGGGVLCCVGVRMHWEAVGLLGRRRQEDTCLVLPDMGGGQDTELACLQHGSGP